MEEWKTYKLKDICIKVTDGSHFSPEGIEEGYPMFSVKDMLEYGFDYSKCKRISEIDYNKMKSSGCVPQKGDVLVAKDGSFLKQIFVCEETLDEAILSSIAIFRPDTSKVCPEYLCYLIKSPKVYDYISKNCVSGSALPRIVLKAFKEVELSIPSLYMQKSIVARLKCIDDKIRINNRINHNLEEQAQIVFDRIFNSDLTNNCLLSSIVDINPKRTLRKNEVARCIDMTYLNTAGSFPSGWEFKPYSGGMKFINGDTLMARITPCLENGKVAYINFLDKDETAFGSTEYIVFHAKEGYPNEMFYFLTRNKAFIEFATKNMNGSSGRQRVSGETIGNYIIPVLSEDDINELKTVSESTMKEILKNNLESRVLSEMRNTILPKLMSGELKINDLTC